MTAECRHWRVRCAELEATGTKVVVENLRLQSDLDLATDVMVAQARVVSSARKLTLAFPERMPAGHEGAEFNIPAYIVTECRDAIAVLDQAALPGSPAPRGTK